MCRGRGQDADSLFNLCNTNIRRRVDHNVVISDEEERGERRAQSQSYLTCKVMELD
jgi:hypothetical protein